MSFTFNKESQKLAKIALAKYPEDRKYSAVMPFLDIAQRQNNNWLSQDCIEYVATQLEMHSNILTSFWNFSTNKLFNSQCKCMLLIHWCYIIQSIKIWYGL